jgi:hypothetical protein
MSACSVNQPVEQPSKVLFTELGCQQVQQTQHLRRARDLLLPRLLSGQVNLKEN